MATWSASYISDLPDSCFLYIESGGEKDDQGKTVPRSLRHFPYKDADGNIDMPHLRNALARIPQSNLSQAIKDRMTAKAQRMMEEMSRSVDEARSSELWEEARFTIDDAGSGFKMDGPMAVFDKPSVLLSEFDLDAKSRGLLARTGKRTFREVIHSGAFAKSLSEKPDIVLHYQHNENTLPLGRTRSGTLTLTEEAGMVRATADLPDNEWGRPVRDAVRRGDIGGISFRMGPVRQEWDGDALLPDGYRGPVRHLYEVQLRREISLVTFPAYAETAAAIRALAEEADVEPDELAAALAVLRTPDARLDERQHHLLQTAIAAKVDAPFIDPKLIQMRERLGPPPSATLAAG